MTYCYLKFCLDLRLRSPPHPKPMGICENFLVLSPPKKPKTFHSESEILPIASKDEVIQQGKYKKLY